MKTLKSFICNIFYVWRKKKVNQVNGEQPQTYLARKLKWIWTCNLAWWRVWTHGCILNKIIWTNLESLILDWFSLFTTSWDEAGTIFPAPPHHASRVLSIK